MTLPHLPSGWAITAFSDITKGQLLGFVALANTEVKADGLLSSLQHRDTVRDTGQVDSTAMIGPSCLLAGKQWFLSGLCFHETIKIAEATYSTSHTCMHYALDCTNWAEPVCLQCICWLKAKRCVARGVNRGMSASFATHFSLCLLCLRK